MRWGSEWWVKTDSPMQYLLLVSWRGFLLRLVGCGRRERNQEGQYNKQIRDTMTGQSSNMAQYKHTHTSSEGWEVTGPPHP
jgi:hypothetical protein